MKKLPYPYEIRGGQVYRYDEIIEGADPETFEVFSVVDSKDSNSVYRFGKKLEGADPKTFTI